MASPVVVFTGPAKLASGQTILREALVKASAKAGLRMAKTWCGDAAFLVSSRDDTVKARKAKEQGKVVFTYDDYVLYLQNLGVDPLDPAYAEGVVANPIVDDLPKAPEPWQAVDINGAMVL